MHVRSTPITHGSSTKQTAVNFFDSHLSCKPFLLSEYTQHSINFCARKLNHHKTTINFINPKLLNNNQRTTAPYLKKKSDIKPLRQFDILGLPREKGFLSCQVRVILQLISNSPATKTANIIG